MKQENIGTAVSFMTFEPILKMAVKPTSIFIRIYVCCHDLKQLASHNYSKPWRFSLSGLICFWYILHCPEVYLITIWSTLKRAMYALHTNRTYTVKSVLIVLKQFPFEMSQRITTLLHCSVVTQTTAALFTCNLNKKLLAIAGIS